MTGTQRGGCSSAEMETDTGKRGTEAQEWDKQIKGSGAGTSAARGRDERNGGPGAAAQQ